MTWIFSDGMCKQKAARGLSPADSGGAGGNIQTFKLQTKATVTTFKEVNSATNYPGRLTHASATKLACRTVTFTLWHYSI